MFLVNKSFLRRQHVTDRFCIRIQIRCVSSVQQKIVKPRLQSSIDTHSETLNQNKRQTVPKAYKSKDASSRLINVYESVIDSNDNDLDSMMEANRRISKSMKSKMDRTSNRTPDISANFKPTVTRSERREKMDGIHGIIEMFADDTDRSALDDDEEEWYLNPGHIDDVEEYLKSKKLPFIDPDLDHLRSVRLTEDMIQSDRIRGGFTSKMTQRRGSTIRNQRRIRRKMRRKQRGNDIENMTKNELIQRDGDRDTDSLRRSPSSPTSSSAVMRRESETEDLCLQTWDSEALRFSNDRNQDNESRTESNSISRSVRSQRANKLKNLWRRFEGENELISSNLSDLRLSNVSPHWLQYKGIDPVVLNSLSHRLSTPSRHFSKTPQGLYTVDDGTRRTLQKVLVSEY